MSDLFYHAVRWAGWVPWMLSSRPTVLHRERVPASGRVLLAPNHLSPYDVLCLIASLHRPVDFLSITEMFRVRAVGWFFSHMNAFPLDRRRNDYGAVRAMIGRLERERALAIFPEGGIRKPSESLLAGGKFSPGIVRVARLGDAPIVPCVMLGTGVFSRPAAWAPFRRGRYGVAFGEAIRVGAGPEAKQEEKLALERLRRAYAELYQELSAESGLDVHSQPWRTRIRAPAHPLK